MNKSRKPLILTLVVVCVASLVITGVLAYAQIGPDYVGGAWTGPGERYEEQWTLPIAAGDGLYVDLSAVSVEIVAYEGDQIEAVFEGTRTESSEGELPYIEITSTGGRVTAREVHTNETVIFNIGLLSTGEINGTLILRVPRILLGDLSVVSFSGNQDIEGLTASSANLDASSGSVDARGLILDGGRLTVTTFSGNQTLSGVTAGETVLDASSGNIKLEGWTSRALSATTFSGRVTASDARIDQELALDTSSGSAELTGVTAGSIESVQFSGRLTLRDVRASGDATLETSSGTIDGERVEADILRAKTFSGDIRFRETTASAMDGDTSSGRFEADLLRGANLNVTTFSGRVDLKLPADAGFSYGIDTFSGGIDVGFAATTSRSGDSRNSSASGVVGDGTHAVTISTSSGGVSIQPR